MQAKWTHQCLHKSSICTRLGCMYLLPTVCANLHAFHYLAKGPSCTKKIKWKGSKIYNAIALGDKWTVQPSRLNSVQIYISFPFSFSSSDIVLSFVSLFVREVNRLLVCVWVLWGPVWPGLLMPSSLWDEGGKEI